MDKEIAFTYQGQELKGILIQEKDGQSTVKLSTGYNIIVPTSELHGVKAKDLPHAEGQPRKVHQDASLPKVTILHTGGTIASKVDYTTGAVTNRFTPEEIIAMFPEMLTLANVSSRLLRNMASDDMRFAHYNIMARAVLEEIGHGATGVIITHGTDTMHHTAAALSFALEGLSIPVMLVGAQRSSDRGSSDASSNLMGALRFITRQKAPGVFIAMHERSDDTPIAIIDGLHARKNHSSRRDAFVSVNVPIVARVTDKVEVVDAARLAAWQERAVAKPRVMPFKEDLKVGLWKVHTHCFADEILVYDHYAGLVIEGTGLGHIPMNETDEFTQEHTRISNHVEKLAKKMPVAIATQTVFGRVDLNVYRPQRILKGFGVLGDGCDMPAEVAFIKLGWLLSTYSPTETRELYAKNLRGEISECSPLEDAHKGE
jgi:glutamyl-tRNA(Gln) amidotransferase subunit D